MYIGLDPLLYIYIYIITNEPILFASGPSAARVPTHSHPVLAHNSTLALPAAPVGAEGKGQWHPSACPSSLWRCARSRCSRRRRPPRRETFARAGRASSCAAASGATTAARASRPPHPPTLPVRRLVTLSSLSSRMTCLCYG